MHFLLKKYRKRNHPK